MNARPDDATEGIDTDRGLSATRQMPVSPAAVIDLEREDATVTEVWRDLLETADVRDRFIRAVRALATDRTASDLLDELAERDVPRHLRGKVLAVARGDRRRAWHLAADVVPGLAGGRSTVEDLLATAGLFDATPEPAVIAVHMGPAFRDRRREQREDVLELVATLARGFDVRLLTTGLTRAWLAREHREALPAEFREQCTTGPSGPSSVADDVEAARERFDADGRAVQLLRDVAAEPGETLPYGALTSMHTVSDSRISQLVGDLEDADLVEKYGPRTAQQVELRPAGRSFLDTIDEEIGRQQRLDAEFSDTGQSSDSDVLPRPHTRAPPDGPPDQPPGESAGAPYRTRYLGRADHAGAVATATDGAIVAAEAPTPDVTDVEDRHTRFVSYDADRDEALVAVRVTTPIQYMVSVALALASPRLFDEALPTRRLADLDDPPAILRDARCIGGLSAEAVEDPEVLRENLVEWGEDLEAMTSDLRNGECEDRDRLCGEILRSAHGLAGSIVHLLDAVGVDLVRELRVPALGDEDMASLARTVSVATAIQSKYGAFTAYRQLFETREEKRRTALSPDVDAEDPVGEYIGSLVLRGPSARRLGQHVEGRLASPAPLHEDAPEFVVPVSVRTPDRTAYAEAVARMLATKALRSTPEAVTMFRALAGDPWAVAEAVRWLGEEETPRRIRLDEVRISLAALEPDRLLPGAPPTVSKAVATLLRTSSPLTQTALAEKAGVSTRSLRRHLAVLEALDLVRETGEGFRLALPFQDGERGDRVLPDAVDDDLAAAQDLVFDVVATLVDDPSRFGDPSDPVGATFIHFPPDFGRLQAHLPAVTPWVRVAKTLCNDPEPSPSPVEIGPSVEQAPLTPTRGVAGDATETTP